MSDKINMSDKWEWEKRRELIKLIKAKRDALASQERELDQTIPQDDPRLKDNQSAQLALQNLLSSLIICDRDQLERGRQNFQEFID